jgi:hypothetical protein
MKNHLPQPMSSFPFPFQRFLLWVMLIPGVLICTGHTPRSYAGTSVQSAWVLLWSDDFSGPAHTGVDVLKWICDSGSGYGCPGCPSNWGTGEVESMSNSTDNVYLDGSGHLAIKPIRDSQGNWTSGRIETKADFLNPLQMAL